MELNLQPAAPSCHLTGRPFQKGDRVASYLVRAAGGEVTRCDALVSAEDGFAPEGFVFCRWVHEHKPKAAGENPERALKLTAENLFLTLADPAAEPDPANTPLLQFLALMLERKKLLRPRGRTADGAREIYEHAKSKLLYEVPAGELTPEFFIRVQAQLGVLVGEPKPKVAVAAEGAAAPAQPAAAE